MNGHIIKYKTKDGRWVEIPIAIVTMYATYTAYCEEHNIAPVDETTYYRTLGTLQGLVETLENKTGSIDALVDALGTNAALPTSMGGTGKSHGSYMDLVTELYNILTANDDTFGPNAHLVTSYNLKNFKDELNPTIGAKFDKSSIASGSTTPDLANLSDDVIYYFQY